SDQFGWSRLGSAAVVDGNGVLTEDENFTSRFSQTFEIPAGATALRFTIHSASFADDPNSPPDAFEVALLDACTGQPVGGVARGPTGTDALLNIPPAGTPSFGGQVTVPGVSAWGPAGSYDQPRTVVVDLSSVAPGTAVTLFFDLLGFGALGSRVVIDNVFV